MVRDKPNTAQAQTAVHGRLLALCAFGPRRIDTVHSSSRLERPERKTSGRIGRLRGVTARADFLERCTCELPGDVQDLAGEGRRKPALERRTLLYPLLSNAGSLTCFSPAT